MVELVAAFQGWEYRSEGNGSLVISNRQSGLVYRLLKEDVAPPTSQPKHGEPKHGEPCTAIQQAGDLDISKESRPMERVEMLEQRVRAMRDYRRAVIKPILEDASVIPEMVPLSPAFLEGLREFLANRRPAQRKGKEIATGLPYALQLPDLCFLSPPPPHGEIIPTFAVEIKMHYGRRFGCSPNMDVCWSRNLRQELANSVWTNCIRADAFACCGHPANIHVANRLHFAGLVLTEVKKDRERTGYCPMDLFAGDEDRMMFALQSLLESYSCFYVKMKIFKDGVQVVCSTAKSLPECVTLIENLLSPYFRNSDGQTSVSQLLALVIQALLHSEDSQADISATSHNQSTSHLEGSDISSSSTRLVDGSSNGVSSPQSDTAAALYSPLPTAPVCRESRYPGPAKHSSLPKGSVLDRIHRLQKLDSVGLQAVYSRNYLPLRAYLDHHPMLAASMGLAEDQVGLEYTASLWHPDQPPFHPEVPSEMLAHFDKVRAYLSTRTGMDCSVIVTLRPDHGAQINGQYSHGNELPSATLSRSMDLSPPDTNLQTGGRKVFHLVDSCGLRYSCVATVIDGDPKSFSNIPHYFRTMTKATNHYTSRYINRQPSRIISEP